MSTKDLENYDSTYIIGGEIAVSSTVANELNNVTRLAGNNRYETNVEVLNYFGVEANNLLIATGLDFVDALTGAVLAANQNTGVGLVRRDVNPDLIDYYNTQFFTNFTLLGGKVAVPDTVYNTLNSYLSSTEILEEVNIENEVPYETIERENKNLLVGESKVSQEGKNGYNEVTYKILYENGAEVNRIVLSQKTVEPVNKIIEIGTKVIDMESIEILNSDVSLYENQDVQLSADILPDNATYPNVYWSSSDKEIVSITQEGLVSTHKEGVVEISVSNESKTVSDSIVLTILKPVIEEVQDLTYTITEFETFFFPETINVSLSNGLDKQVDVTWENESISNYEVGEYTFNGVIDEYDYEVNLKLIVNEYVPNITTRSYSQVTFNNLSRGLSLSIYNRDFTEVRIDKIELYERDRLFASQTAERLETGGIHTIIEPGDDWGISMTFRIGMFLDNSYVKYYLNINGKEYVYIDRLD